MEKAILILTGTPSGKSRFDSIITQKCWRWNVSAKNWLAEIAKSKLYWSAEDRDENYHKTLANFYEFVNREFDFESHYIREAINRFRAFDADKMTKVDDQNQETVFVKFLCVLHGITKELTSKLEQDEGAMQIHVTSRALNTNIYHHDYVLYEDDADFEQQVEKVIDILTNTTKKEKVNAAE